MKHRLNLLPKEFQDAMASTRSIKRWMVIYCLMGAVSLGILYKERLDVLGLEAVQQRNSAEVKSLRLMQQESQTAREKLEELSTKHTLVSMLESELPVVQILGVFSQSARDPDRRIEVAEFARMKFCETPNRLVPPQSPRTLAIVKPRCRKKCWR